MRRQIIAMIVVIGLSGIGAVREGSVSAQDRNCENFFSQQEAQAYFESGGGSPSYNFNNLDADHDGMACDDYPYGTAPVPTVEIPATEPLVVVEPLPTETATTEPPTVTPTMEPSIEATASDSPSPSARTDATEPVAPPTAAPPNVRANPAPTATAPPRRTAAAAATNRNDPDYTLGRIDVWLALERDAGETLRTGMADPDFTDPSWYVEQSSAVGIILAVQADMQGLEAPSSIDDVAIVVQAASDRQAAAAATCDMALVSNDLADATQCLDAIDVATGDVADLRDAIRSWDGETLKFRPSV